MALNERIYMAVSLKPLKEQVMVITGASSGIGLCTAQSAAKQGAKVILAARSQDTLNDVVNTLTAMGADCMSFACDVADRSQVEKLAQATIDRYKRIDTWVN